MVVGTGVVGDSQRGSPAFQHTASDTPQARRRPLTVHWHRALRSLLYLIALVFVILVIIGNLSNKPVLRSTYFLYLDLSNIIPLSVPNAVFINSIAQSIGLHDFYTVGLLGFCEGYNVEGITSCSKPKALYAFNPVEIIVSELLSGASIALPSEISQPLNLARTASHWMYGLFITSAVLNFVMIFLSPLAVSSRPPQAIKYVGDHELAPTTRLPHRRQRFVWLRSFPFVFLSFFAALVTIAGSVIATVMFTIFANVFSNADPNLNISAHVGVQMMAFMWVASGFSLIAFILQLGSCCAACCGGRKVQKRLQARGMSLHEKRSPSGSDPGTSEASQAETQTRDGR
ncbi:hypothetical protein N7539_004296 [Penicillium diatomitis]|uniref:Integral membrane protein n=1 Tax=Penicillium diatomitis TaxID=2819901 RepID=A0A9W9XDU8_9EURO|nr:uncharacterized protein N7539_004296 [Penicillium diatomitis]KAJ5489406.1 hypothetical protein N7539_004296 [Penicillium diatomitis]